MGRFQRSGRGIAASLIAAVAVVSGGFVGPRLTAAGAVQCTPPIPCVDNTVQPQFEGYALFHQVYAGAVGYAEGVLASGTGSGLRKRLPLATATTTDTADTGCDPNSDSSCICPSDPTVGPCGDRSGPDGCSYYTCNSSTVSWDFGTKQWTGNMGTGSANGGWFVVSTYTGPDCDGSGTCFMHAGHGEFNQVQSSNGDYGICGVSAGMKVNYQVSSVSSNGQNVTGNMQPINYNPNTTNYYNSGNSTGVSITAADKIISVGGTETWAGGTEQDGGYNANAHEYDVHTHWTDKDHPCQDTSISVRAVSDWEFTIPSDWESWQYSLGMPVEYTYQD